MSARKKKSKTNSSSPLLRMLNFFRLDTLNFKSDLWAGLTVAVVLIPQSLAYAQLAGLPPQYGLYAALLPPLVAVLLGSSRYLSTGPTAVVSLMSATAIGAFAINQSPEFVLYTAVLALGLGVFQLLLGALKLGSLFSFISHPVVLGFTNAAAIIIVVTELPKFFGVNVGDYSHLYETVIVLAKSLVSEIHMPTLLLGLVALVLMYVLKKISHKIPYVLIAVVLAIIFSWGTNYHYSTEVALSDLVSEDIAADVSSYKEMLTQYESLQDRMRTIDDRFPDIYLADLDTQKERLELDHSLRASKTEIATLGNKISGFRLFDLEPGDHKFILASTLGGSVSDDLIWRIDLDALRSSSSDEFRVVRGGAILGAVPNSLPGLTIPHMDLALLLRLLPAIILISLIAFAESNSVSQVVAVKTQQRIDPNREILGQGVANLVSGITGGMPVAGSFSRTAVNLNAGAKSSLAGVFTFAFVLVAILFLARYLYYLPQVVLSAIVILAVSSIIDLGKLVDLWKASYIDGVAALLTFIATLYFAPNLEIGVFLGVVFSLAFYLYHQAKPRIVFLSKYKDGSFHDAELFHLARCKSVAVVRFDADLFFANAVNLENVVINDLAKHPKIKKVVIVCTGVNELDATGEEVLSELLSRLRKTKKDVYFTSLKQPVVQMLKRSGLYDEIGEDHIFATAEEAVKHVTKRWHKHEGEKRCPLLHYESVAHERTNFVSQFLSHLSYLSDRI
ncbi:SulP family inorganic anion transporter [candidate division WWE3 bacterium]|uniref:SulP family inorganic anion transporter n=1 Tax=candidate division WWE3 bacterium TaxID=2053526 RepID=A0A955LKS0_UNCKA|nr:SulP family inorganic anion transporter [candidate division WWE3 bacterium]